MKSKIFMLSVALLGMGVARADTIIVDNLAASYSAVNGVVNGVNEVYAQGFNAGDGGYLDSVTLDLALAVTGGIPNPANGETAAFYLFNADPDSGTPTGPSLATLATGITLADIESGTFIGGPTYWGSSDIYQYSLNLLSDPYLTSGGSYAIEMILSGSTERTGLGTPSLGWAEVGFNEPAGEIGTLDTGYGALELDPGDNPDPPPPLSDASSTALLLGAVLAGFALVKSKLV
ncbi:MAG: hypothetical protein ABSA05_00380 [Opitutaceae bacterium]|jgi:hypothetical protein